jgi:micrococcal nuclease
MLRRWFRRLTRLALLTAAVGAVIGLRQLAARRHGAPELGPPATWPPLERGEEPVGAVGDLAAATTPPPSPGAPPAGDEPVAAVGDLVADAAEAPSATESQAWVAPVDGACPVSHPIKANANSRIYHQPGGRFYDRTQAERCYADAAAAEVDGYRAAKGS